MPDRYTDLYLGSILDADWVFDVAHGSTSIPDDVGAVAVIDGSKSILRNPKNAYLTDL